MRANKLRIAWFLLGMASGAILSLSFAGEWRMPAMPNLLAWLPQTASESGPQKPSPEELALLTIVARESDPNVINAPTDTLYPLTVILKVENGDTLVNLLTDTGVSQDEASGAVKSISKAYDVKRLNVGQSVTVEIDKENIEGSKPLLKSIVLPTSATTSLEISRNAKNEFNIKKVQAVVERKLMKVSGKIDSSLYETAVGQGLPPALLADLIAAYSYDVDFQRDIRRGNKITALYERLETKEGLLAGYGNVIFADLDLGDRRLKIYRYIDKTGFADYYNSKGESVRKALLRTPVNGAKITSGFGMRNHPILGYSKMHRGVDFGAPIGTPIYAAGDGKVDFLGNKGGYGNYLRIRHNGMYATAYGHISRFAKGISFGSKVRQGQIVAYVGMTGLSTGPHLHYEVMVNNSQVNPSKVKFKTGNTLGGKELAGFRQNMETIEAELRSMAPQAVASATDIANAAPSANR